MSPRRVTLSTVGHRAGAAAAGARAADAEPRDFAARDDRRAAKRAGPAEPEVPLAEILETCRRFPLERRSRITFEYVMLDGVNDTPEDARRLARLLVGDQGEGEPDSAQPGARHSVRAPVG